MAGTVIVPWYATGFRADDFDVALGEVAATALRYGASSYAVYRAQDDRYKFQQFAAFAEHVAITLARTIPGVTLDRGYAIADTIHNSGQAVVWSGHREAAELYWERLHEAGLTMAPLERG